MVESSQTITSTESESENAKRLLGMCYAEKSKGMNVVNDSIHMGFSAVMTALPSKRPPGHIFQRKHGSWILTIMANHKFGLPYGASLKLILISIINEMKETNSPVLYLEKIYSKILYDLNVEKYQDKHVDSTHIYDQMLRLFSAHIACNYKNEHDKIYINRTFDFWSNPLNGNKKNLSLNTTVVLTTDFFNELINFPVQVDFKILQALRHSPIQIDFYVWLMCQFSSLKAQTLTHWNYLINLIDPDGMGCNQGLEEFKEKVSIVLQLIAGTCNSVSIEIHKDGIILKPHESTMERNNHV